MKRKKLLLALGITIICLVSAVIYIKAKAGISVEVSTVEKGEIKEFVEDIGTVQSNKRQIVYIEGNGKINNINFDVGDMVKTGDILLTMDKKDLELKLKEAELKIEQAKAQFASTDISNYINKIELAQIDVDKAKMDYDSKTKNLENLKTLYEAGAISKQEFENGEDEYKNAEINLKGANLKLDDIQNGTPNYVKEGYKVGIEQAVMEKYSINTEIEKQQLLSPINGTIIEKLVDINSMGAQGVAAFSISDINSLELETNILSDDISKVKIGDEVEISGKPIGEHNLKGKVIKIAPEAKGITSALGINQKRVSVKIEISDSENLLKPGYDLNAKIITEKKNDSLIVPDSAVFDYKGESSVFVVEDNRAIIRKIKKGIESENTLEVLEGLEENEKIIKKPSNNIKEGIKIKNSLKG